MHNPKTRKTVSVEPLDRRLLLAVGTLSEQIIVDQIGWRPGDKKVAIFADPVTGQNAAISYTPGSTFQVRVAGTDAVAFTGTTVSWRSGTTDPVSGDRVWQGDFSPLTAPGEYYLYDPANDLRSYNFVITNDVYNDLLTTSLRAFYYQRMGTAIPATYGGNWAHAVDHTNDTHALLWQSGPVANTARDVSGGWMDAGDYNKYVPFTTSPLWNLLTAYEWNPANFSDHENVPESGNGTPDLLDEVKYELDWLLKMQKPDGSVINRVANSTYASGNADPATDTQARYYTASTTWATASFAASLAHAARVFAAFNPTYASTLLTAAQNAWSYLQVQTTMFPTSGTDGGGSGGGPGNLAAAAASADASYDLRLRILAAAELFKTTGSATYKSYFDAHYKDAASAESGFQPLRDGTPRFDASLALDLNHAYVTYATAPGATASIVTEIKNAARAVDQSWLALGEYQAGDDPYRAFMWAGHYTWGSNQLKAEWANLLLYAYHLSANPANNAQHLEAAEEYLHYFHGRNPLSYVYLSNTGTKGANVGTDKSPLSIYHSWYADGSAKYDGPTSLYGPAPGFLVGGPNQYYSGGRTPPTGEPPAKAFYDFNSVPDSSWEITEPAIYYQAAYSLLLSQFATTPSPTWLKAQGGAAYSFTGSPGAETLHITGGSVTLTATAWTDRPGLAIAVENGAKVTLQSPQRFSSISIASTATLDLNSQSLLVDYTGASPSDALRQLLRTGNITSSPATANHSIGYAEASALGLTTFLSQPVDTTAVLLKSTWTGDANLDGKLNADDYALADRGKAKNLGTWVFGDFNYDGAVTTADYTLLNAAYNASRTPAPTTPAAETTTTAVIPIIPLRVSAGGDWFTDSLSRTFQPDAGFTGGASAASSPYDVQDTTDDPLFLTYHAGPSFTFSAPVPAAGHYTLWLEFAEPDPAALPGQRVFSVQAEGVTILTDFDIAATAGPQRAIAKAFDLTLTDGTLNLSFLASAGYAQISAISLLPTDPPADAAPYSWQALSDPARTVLDASHLANLGQLIFFYANDHRGNLPADLATADAAERLLGPDAFISPRAASAAPRGLMTAAERAAWIASRHDYIYLGGGKRLRDIEPSDVFAYDNPDRVAGDINVLFADGHVESLSRSAAAALIGFPDAPPSDPPPPPPSVPAPDPRILQSQSNLRSIAQHLQSFANSNRNIYPTTLGQIATAFHLPASTFLNPRSTTSVPPNTWTDAEEAAWIDANTDYVFLAAGKRASQFGPGDVLAYEKPDGMTGGINLLFGDGHTEYREFPYADETLAPVTAPSLRDASFTTSPTTQSLSFRFTEDVSLPPTALTLTDSSSNPVPTTLTYNRAAHTATFSFSPLPTGLYHATLSSPLITDSTNNHPAADLPFDFAYVAANTRLTLPPDQTIKLHNLTIDPTGTLDLSNSTVILDYTFSDPTAAVRTWLSTGRHAGTWDGPGLVTSDPTLGPNRAIAYADSSTLGLNSLAGQSIDATAIILKYTYAGDANLDGRITADDYALADRGLAKHLTTWTAGDFDYDGQVTPDDYTLLNRSYAATHPPQPEPVAPTVAAPAIPSTTAPTSPQKTTPHKKPSAPRKKPLVRPKAKLNHLPPLRTWLQSCFKLLWHR